MKREDFAIWKELMDNRNEFVSITSLCYKCEMSRRQMSSRINKMGLPYLVRDRDNSDTYYKLSCTLEEAANETMYLLSQYYRCKLQDIEDIISMVSYAGVTSLDEICDGTTFSHRNTAYILSMMPTIKITHNGSKNQYIKLREGNVSVCL